MHIKTASSRDWKPLCSFCVHCSCGAEQCCGKWQSYISWKLSAGLSIKSPCVCSPLKAFLLHCFTCSSSLPERLNPGDPWTPQGSPGVSNMFSSFTGQTVAAVGRLSGRCKWNCFAVCVSVQFVAGAQQSGSERRAEAAEPSRRLADRSIPRRNAALRSVQGDRALY